MRLSVTRKGARIWIEDAEGRRTGLVMSEAEGLAGIVERMDATPGPSDVQIGSVGVRRDTNGTAILLHVGDSPAICPVSALDVGAFALLLRMAVTSRIFSGSIGTGNAPAPAPRPTPEQTTETPLPAPTSLPAPSFVAGGSLTNFVPSARPRRRQTRHGLAPIGARGGVREVPTFRWDPPQSLELGVVDAMSAAEFSVLRALWHRFEEGHWIGIEWVRNYASAEVWRTTRRDRPVSLRQEVAEATMQQLEASGIVDDAGAGLRVPSQACYDLWRATMLAGGMDHRDERMSSTIDVPVGYVARDMERLRDLDTCIVVFDRGIGTAVPYAIDEDSVGEALRQDLLGMGIDPRHAEIGVRLGSGIYPERRSVYGQDLHSRISRGDRTSAFFRPEPAGLAWDARFLALTGLTHAQQRSLDRFRMSLKAPSIPTEMPAVERPDDWQDDPLLREGAEKRRRQMLGRIRTRSERAGLAATRPKDTP